MPATPALSCTQAFSVTVERQVLLKRKLSFSKKKCNICFKMKSSDISMSLWLLSLKYVFNMIFKEKIYTESLIFNETQCVYKIKIVNTDNYFSYLCTQ